LATVSSKYQVVIPKSIRESMGIKPGDKVRFMLINGSLRVIRDIPLQDLKGTLRGMPAEGLRDEDDRY
jgi:AbrB family looped-hinge helix DNA binding protein